MFRAEGLSEGGCCSRGALTLSLAAPLGGVANPRPGQHRTSSMVQAETAGVQLPEAGKLSGDPQETLARLQPGSASLYPPGGCHPGAAQSP